MELIHRPDELGREALERARAAGVSDAALEDAIHVCSLWILLTRVVDAFGSDGGTEEIYRKEAERLFEWGYAVDP